MTGWDPGAAATAGLAGLTERGGRGGDVRVR